MKRVMFCLLLCLLASGAVNAAVTIDPTTGWSGTMNWAGTGPIDNINGNPADTEWQITVPTDVSMYLITADETLPALGGNEFALVLDGAPIIPWTSSYTDGDGLFHAQQSNLFLSAGTHTLSFLVYQTNALGLGTADVEFSAVPAPGAFLLTALGTGVAGLIRRKRFA